LLEGIENLQDPLAGSISPIFGRMMLPISIGILALMLFRDTLCESLAPAIMKIGDAYMRDRRMQAEAKQMMTIDDAALGLSKAWRTGGMQVDGEAFLGAVAAVDEAVCRAHGAEPARGVLVPETREARIQRIARATMARHAASPLTCTLTFWENVVTTILDEADRPHPRVR
jgi:hypothetical protein